MFLLSVGGEACDVRLSLKHGRSMKPELVCANSTLEAAKEDRYCGFYSTNQCTNFLDLTGPLVVGGLPPSKQAEATPDDRFPGSFVGCVRDLHIDRQPVNMNQVLATLLCFCHCRFDYFNLISN